MGTRISFIADITTATKFPWTVKVVVLEKMPIRESRQSPEKFKSKPLRPSASPTKYQRLIVADSQGTRVQLTIFGKDIDIFEDNLNVGKIYLVSNCKVSWIEEQHKIVPFDYQWNLGAASLVKPVADGDEMVIPVFNNFIPFSGLHLYKDSPTRTVDIVGVALHMLPIMEQPTKSGPARIQRIILINTEIQPMMITLWNQFIETEGAQLYKAIYRKPVIVAKRLRVVSYNGLSLTTKAQSTFAIDLDMPQANEMQVWLANNLPAVNAFMNSKTFNAFAENPKRSVQDELVLISELPKLPDNRNYPLNCTLEVIDFDQAFWYMGCNKCYKATTAAFMEVYTCNHCKRANANAIPRCCVPVRATDSSGMISASLFGTDAEKFLGCTAAIVMENMQQDGSHQSYPLPNYKTNGEIKTTVRPYHQDFRGESIRKFNITFKNDEEAPIDSEATVIVTPSAKRALFQTEPSTPSKKKKEGTKEVIAEGPSQDPIDYDVNVLKPLLPLKKNLLHLNMQLHRNVMH